MNETAAFRHRQRAPELRVLAADEMNAFLRYKLFEIAAQYEQFAASAEALAGIKRYERPENSAVILPFGPRAGSESRAPG